MSYEDPYRRSEWDTRDPEFWRTPADDNETWPMAIATTAVFVIVCVVLYLAILTAAAAR